MFMLVIRDRAGQDERMGFNITGDPKADALLDESPFALLAGMMLDQQMPMERAFAGPQRLAERLGTGTLGTGTLDVAAIAAYDPERFAELFSRPPAIHRFPGSMAGRVQALARHILEEYDGDAEAIWRDSESGGELLARLHALPGFGEQKARIFLALLGKQFGMQPAGWREAAGAYGEEGSRRSVADVVDAATLAEVRAYKQEAKRAAKAGHG